MRQTSITARRRLSSRAFTLIELSVVIIILMVTAALVFPNLTSMREGIEARNFLASLPQIASEARETAITKSATTKLTYDDSQKAILISQEKDGEDDKTLKTISLPKGMAIQDFQLNGDTSNAGEWELRFFSDGQSDTGGIEADDNRRAWSLIIDKYGIGKLQEGALPSESQSRWAAGDYEHRL